MPTQSQILAAALAAVVAYDLTTRPLRNRNLRLSKTIIMVHEENESLKQQMAYLVNLLNEHGVVLDEFDLIVLTNVIKQS